jgi:MoxR-like ATPase
VPKLVLLNGPPAVGKSTVARRYADSDAAYDELVRLLD